MTAGLDDSLAIKRVRSPTVGEGLSADLPSLTVGLLTLSTQFLQTLRGQHQRFVLLTKTEANLLRAFRGIAIETGTRHAGNADFANQVTREFNVILEAKAADVGHDVISAVG